MLGAISGLYESWLVMVPIGCAEFGMPFGKRDSLPILRSSWPFANSPMDTDAVRVGAAPPVGWRIAHGGAAYPMRPLMGRGEGILPG
jgi:hypothetical protein